MFAYPSPSSKTYVPVKAQAAYTPIWITNPVVEACLSESPVFPEVTDQQTETLS